MIFRLFSFLILVLALSSLDAVTAAWVPRSADGQGGLEQLNKRDFENVRITFFNEGGL